MLPRRDFLAVMGGALCSCVPKEYPRAEVTDDEPFFCLTPDLAPSVPGTLIFNDSTPLNAPLNFTTESVMQTLNFTPYGTAFPAKAWGLNDGLTPGTGVITLGIYFRNASSTQKAAAIDAASQWLKTDVAKRFDFRFDVPVEKSHARVTFDPKGGNWSLVGNENMKRTAGNIPQTTMNLQQLYRYAIEHEFGHLLGLEHEHQFPSNSIQWHQDTIIADLHRLVGWTKAQTTANMLTKLPVSSKCIGDPYINLESVMMYPILKGWADYDDGSGTPKELIIPGTSLISDRDVKCLRGVYNF
jgi:hypothetical protein